MRERATVTMRNVTFQNSNSDMGAVILFIQNFQYGSFIQNCSFFNNFAKSSLFALTNSILSINESIFENSLNSMFMLTNSIINLYNTTVINLQCDNNIYGCFINRQDFSSIFLNKVYVENSSTTNWKFS